ncbi:stress responsive A/B barrel domain protein [Oxobacter pfennigii]|uniref:Stress responsive A/B barrel domain protein n=1 Tax=Oxobacter pfennigii TaxID=36849 RepID=A0A0P8Y8S0_9CLOT|nr:Dabb family protein [Oxobacter pfennigii]KPU43133.1 stress responsive A/B barrel domain protein [Oxobacter pfennigii]
MIKHIVMWTLKDFAEGRSKKENAEIVKMSLEGLKDKIKEIKFIEVGINFSESESAFDIALYSEFETIEDLNVYQAHPEHIKAGEFVNKVRDKRISADYEI